MSLRLRIIASVTLVLAVFITLTVLTLERAFRSSAETALRERLTSQLYALMAAAELDDRGKLEMPADELDALLGVPGSGMYAVVTNDTGQALWRSVSALEARPPKPEVLAAGERRFSRVSRDGHDFYRFAFGVNWPLDDTSLPLSFTIVTDLAGFEEQVAGFRHTLWSWLGGMGILLLLSQAAILRWGLSPLHRVERELEGIEHGEQDSVTGHYPRELERLTVNINRLLSLERRQRTRYRHALADLAHSLKTPLAVIRNTLSTGNGHAPVLDEQVTRMNHIVEYQLQRAVSGGGSGLGQAVPVAVLARRLIDSLHKVYRDKVVEVQVNVDDALNYRGDEGDLMELLGNLLDNAFKWAVQRIELTGEIRQGRLQLSVEDDGPGIAAEQARLLLERGARADQSTAGHGIGLSIVRALVESADGELRIDHSALGGARVEIRLPVH